MAEAGHTLIAESMLAFEPLPFALPEECDWVFAYSRNGVDGLLAQEGVRAWLRERPGVKFGAIGEKTAAAWRAAGLAVSFVGTGEPASTAAAFAKTASGQRVTFVQAQESRASVEQLLGNRIDARVVRTYRAVPLEVTLPAVDVALLTSPRSAELFLAQCPSLPPNIYCIGPTTAAAVEGLGFAVSGVAAVAGVEALLGMV